MFKQLNYCLPFNSQESKLELFRENFEFYMWEKVSVMQMEVNKEIFEYAYWTYFTFMKPHFLIKNVDILFIY